MARVKGISAFSANFEPQVAAPLDARLRVESLADLVLTATWTAADTGVYAYVGMIVSVYADATPDNNGAYRLTVEDYTQAGSWEKIGTGGGSAEDTTYDNTDTELEATTVQDAIDEVLTRTRGIEKHVDITSSASVLTLNTAYSINCHVLTESAVLAVPDTAAWADGNSVRIDLFVKVDAAGSYALTFNASWMFDGGVVPTLTATANAIDHLVVTVVKSSAVGTIAVVGLAAADIKGTP